MALVVLRDLKSGYTRPSTRASGSGLYKRFTRLAQSAALNFLYLYRYLALGGFAIQSAKDGLIALGVILPFILQKAHMFWRLLHSSACLGRILQPILPSA